MISDTTRGQDFRYRFGAFELDPQTWELTRGEELLRLEPKAFELLVYLLEHRDRVVRKAELYRALWGDACVCEGVLPQCISVLRRTLGDTGRTLLKTYPRVGYRFVGAVEVTERASDLPEPPAPWWPAPERTTDLMPASR